LVPYKKEADVILNNNYCSVWIWVVLQLRLCYSLQHLSKRYAFVFHSPIVQFGDDAIVKIDDFFQPYKIYFQNGLKIHGSWNLILVNCSKLVTSSSEDSNNLLDREYLVKFLVHMHSLRGKPSQPFETEAFVVFNVNLACSVTNTHVLT